MRLSSLLGVAFAALVASFATANAQQQGVRIGVLECRGGQNVGMVIASKTTLECVFNGQGARPEPYLAHVTRIGVDLGVTENTTLALGGACTDPARRSRRPCRQLRRRGR